MGRLVTIILARKPLEGTVVDNVRRWGCGAINIDKSRIQGPAWKWGTQTDIKGGGYGSKRPSAGNVLARDVESDPKGRWPANLVLEHLPGCQKAGVAQVKTSTNHHFSKSSIGGKGVYQGGVARHGTDYANADGTEDVDQWECVDGCPVDDLGEQVGVIQSGAMKTEVGAYDGNSAVPFLRGRSGPNNQRADQGTVSRFFKQVQGSKK